MTILVVALLGAGTILIASALDCTPIVQTFQKIISGQKIDWTGSNCSSSGTSTTAPGGINPQNGCPNGWSNITPSGMNVLVCQAPSGTTSCPQGWTKQQIGGNLVCVSPSISNPIPSVS